MHRRIFCKTALAAGIVAALPACERSTTDPSTSTSISALSSAGQELSLESAAVDELAASLQGRLYRHADEGYDTVRKVWNGMSDDKRPALVVQCASAQDVQNAVVFANELDILLSIKGGGHSFPGKSTCDGGMMIDLSPIQTVSVNPEKRTARVGGGALLGHLDGAALQHELMTTTGIVSHTGVGGFTLGGGMGRTDRLHGLAIDNLKAATVVTADGMTLRASEEENSDLFWALRGGGGNFGVVTEFEFRLHPFSPTVYGGTMVYTFDQLRDLLRLYAELREQLPHEANVEPQWIIGEGGDPVALLEITYSGDGAAGEKALEPLLSFGTRLAGEYGPISYSTLQTAFDAVTAPGQLNYLKSGFMGELSETAIDEMIGNYEGEYRPWVWFQHLGGASSQVGATDTAFVHRGANYNFGVMTTWQDDAESEDRIAAIRRYYNAISPFLGGFYTNLNDEDEQKTWGNYGENYPRLSQIKAQYDPTNLFRLNANIRPAA